jgi:hypothetical protein
MALGVNELMICVIKNHEDMVRGSIKASAPWSTKISVRHCDPFLKKGGKPCVWLEDETQMVDCKWCCNERDNHDSRGWFEKYMKSKVISLILPQSIHRILISPS